MCPAATPPGIPALSNHSNYTAAFIYNEIAMQKALIGIVIVALSLANCDKSPTPPVSSATSGDAVQRKLQELAGNGATDCGRLKQQAVEKPDQMEAASACAMGAAKKKQAFYVAYELPGLIVALAGDSAGKLFTVQQEQPGKAPSGTAAELVATPCPSELRIAQSGRVTCIAPGSMGGSSMGGATAHGGKSMSPGGSASPHGGMNMSPGGAPNPHGTGGNDLPSGHSKSKP
jgi:hypothetical protein